MCYYAYLQSRRLIANILCFLLVTSLLLSCNTNQNKVPSATMTIQSDKLADDNLEAEAQWPQDWLLGIPCKAPCWQGIVPGVTTVTDTITILEGMGDTININVSTSPISSDLYDGAIGNLTWDWQEHGKVWGGMEVYGSPLTVYSILIGNAGHASLEDVIAAYGEPSHVSATIDGNRNPNLYFLRLTFYEQGFALESNRSGSSQKPYFDEQWTGFNVRFFEPTPEGFSRVWGGRLITVDEVARPWEGMLGFGAYATCEGQFCPTP